MDTKLKKSHKLVTFIITLCILLPAFFITALYPKIADALERAEKKRYEEYQEMKERVGPELEMDEHFLNYAMEACYYIYGGILQESTGETVDFRVLEKYGWVNDYRYIRNEFAYSAKYTHDGHTTGTGDEDFGTPEDIGYLTFSFDEYGNLSHDIVIEGVGENNIWINNIDDYEYHSVAMESVEQYEQNVVAYEAEHKIEIDEGQLRPKNFDITFALREDIDRELIREIHGFYVSFEVLMFEIGVLWVMLATIIFVAVVAFVLPFFKRLDTGWEKLFCLPFELIAGLGVGAVFGFIGMFYAIGLTCKFADYPELEIIGLAIPEHVQYGALLAANFLGWAILFFAEYIVITSIRQLLTKPVYYLKNRFLFVWLFRWMKKQCLKLYRWITKIDLTNKLNNSIMKIVLVNFVILTVLCVMWVFGIVGLLIYSVVLFIVLQKLGEKVQKQFNSILNATNQMAEGNLKITLKKDLGMFQPIGDSLEKVQQGFEKAVVEEAKSQNMKTELITNVSHDLKTPLTAIITYVDLLKQENITEEERKSYIQTLEQKSQRLKVLIEDLFEVSKAHSGTVKMNFMDVDIVSLLKEVGLEMYDQIESSDLTFRWNLPEEKVILSLDSQRTYRVFENLLNNALKYALPHSRVYVDVTNRESDVTIMIRNISAQELDFDAERLTERFVRGDASRQSEGSGLGLAIAKSFVELQNGELNIEVDGDLFKVIITWKK